MPRTNAPDGQTILRPIIDRIAVGTGRKLFRQHRRPAALTSQIRSFFAAIRSEIDWASIENGVRSNPNQFQVRTRPILGRITVRNSRNHSWDLVGVAPLRFTDLFDSSSISDDNKFHQ